MSVPVWKQPKIISWSQILVDSFEQLTGNRLIDKLETPEKLAEALFYAPFALVSHGIQTEPIFNYANQTALKLWEITWDRFITMPSRLSAETVNREARAAMLQQAANKGYIDNYHGVRVSSTGKRFLIEKAIVWNLQDRKGNKCGQAATFSYWTFL
ncbi:MAG: MEKHLA domain-containing protein [Pleurocapsa sp.]